MSCYRDRVRGEINVSCKGDRVRGEISVSCKGDRRAERKA